MSFNSIKHVSLAAKLRVAVLEDLQLQQKVRDLTHAMDTTDHLDRLVRWRDWYHSSHVLTLQRALKEARVMGINAPAVYESIVSQLPPSATAQARRQARQSFRNSWQRSC